MTDENGFDALEDLTDGLNQTLSETTSPSTASFSTVTRCQRHWTPLRTAC